MQGLSGFINFPKQLHSRKSEMGVTSATSIEKHYHRAVFRWTISDALSVNTVIKSKSLDHSDIGITAYPACYGSWQVGLDSDVCVYGARSGCVRIFLEHLNTRMNLENVRVIGKISILDGNDQEILTEWTQNGSETPIVLKENYPPAPGLAVVDVIVIPRTQVFKPQQTRYKYIFDGKLRIRAEIIILDGPDANAFPGKVECQLAKRTKKLWDTKRGADYTLISKEGSHIAVHKSLLIAASDVFSAMFLHGFDKEEEDPGCCSLDDMDAETVNGMLEYIYGMNPSNLPEIAERLLPFADRYELSGLKELCGRTLARNLNLENAARMMLLADTSTAEYLKKAVTFFIVKHKKDFVETGGIDEILTRNFELGKELIREFV